MLLSIIFCLLITSLVFLYLTPEENLIELKIIGLFSSGFVFILSCLVLFLFDCNFYYFQNIVSYKTSINALNVDFSFGLDGISVLFFFLSSFLIFLSVIFVLETDLLKESLIFLSLINLFLLLIFSSLDLLVFYVFFEAVLVPMSLLIGLWGSRERKVRAFYLFFFYTLVGSLFMLLGILYIFVKTGSSNLEYLLTWSFTLEEQCWLWLSFFMSFAAKVPIFPLHIWLPEAHVEAPTVGSVLLAGIMLKLGIYGLIRFSLNLFPEASLFFSPMVYLLSVTGVVYASLCAIRQTDLKRVIAYSSIAHMNLVVLGAFSFNVVGLEGCVLQSISHGFVSSAMFFIIGMLYERYGSRFLYYYGGLVHVMPIYSVMFFFFTMANIALPGTSSFIGEFLLLVGIYNSNIVCSIVGTTGVMICGGYSLWLYNRVIFGGLKAKYAKKFSDLDFREFSVLLPLCLLVLTAGIFPSIFLEFIHLTSTNYIIVGIY
jgi:proton-translocating NADH-quinone oxidoreductase chain M